MSWLKYLLESDDVEDNDDNDDGIGLGGLGAAGLLGIGAGIMMSNKVKSGVNSGINKTADLLRTTANRMSKPNQPVQKTPKVPKRPKTKPTSI